MGLSLHKSSHVTLWDSHYIYVKEQSAIYISVKVLFVNLEVNAPRCCLVVAFFKIMIKQDEIFSFIAWAYIEGILPKGPYRPCVSMAGRALLAGYHRYVVSHLMCIFTPLDFSANPNKKPIGHDIDCIISLRHYHIANFMRYLYDFYIIPDRCIRFIYLCVPHLHHLLLVLTISYRIARQLNNEGYCSLD